MTNTVRICPTLRAECYTCMNVPYVVLVSEVRLCESLLLLFADWQKLLTLKREITNMVGRNGKEKVKTPPNPAALGISISFHKEKHLQIHAYNGKSDFHSRYFCLDLNEWDALMEREALITTLMLLNAASPSPCDETLPPLWEKCTESSDNECIYIPSTLHQPKSIIGELPTPLENGKIREYKWRIPCECVTCEYSYYTFEECMNDDTEDVVRRGLYPDVKVHVVWEDKPRVTRGQLLKSVILYQVMKTVNAYQELHPCEACEVKSGGQWRHFEAANGCLRPMGEILDDALPVLNPKNIAHLYTATLKRLHLPKDDQYELRIQHSLELYDITSWSRDLSDRDTSFDHIFKAIC